MRVQSQNWKGSWHLEFQRAVSNENLAEITTVVNKYTNSFFSKCCGRTSAESVSRIADEKFGFFAGSGKC